MDKDTNTNNGAATALASIQTRLVARKDAFNNFGGYKYRSCESILASVKPLLAEKGLRISLSDEVVAVCERVYIKATCTIYDGTGNVVEKTVAFAREELAKKGMDASQCTGSASSYARKYALCGMFAIDDSSVDPDATNDHKMDYESCRVKFSAALSVADVERVYRELRAAGFDKAKLVEMGKQRKSELAASLENSLKDNEK